MTTPVTSDTEELLSIKELAAALHRNRNYVSAMRRLGFLMPGGRATLREARSWLARNPAPRSRKNDLVPATSG